MNDLKLFKWLGLLLLLPIAMAYFSGDRFRYPCQNPDNWDQSMCQKPRCDVTRTCPEHIFKGQRDPRLGPLDGVPSQVSTFTKPTGVTCGK